MNSSGASGPCTASRNNNRRERAPRLLAALAATALVVATLAVAGCESADDLSDRMAERIHGAQPKVVTFAADQHAVFDAALAAVKSMDFRVTRAGAAQGVIKAISDIQSGDTITNARQYSLDIEIHAYEAGRTEVSVILREQEESKSFSGATDIPLKEHGLYGTFFGALADALHQKPLDPAPAN